MPAAALRCPLGSVHLSRTPVYHLHLSVRITSAVHHPLESAKEVLRPPPLACQPVTQRPKRVGAVRPRLAGAASRLLRMTE